MKVVLRLGPAAFGCGCGCLLLNSLLWNMLRWFMMIYDDLWWFMMIYDDLWWFMMIYDYLWWFMMIWYDLIWFGCEKWTWSTGILTSQIGFSTLLWFTTWASPTPEISACLGPRLGDSREPIPRDKRPGRAFKTQKTSSLSRCLGTDFPFHGLWSSLISWIYP